MVGWHHRLNAREFEQTPEMVKDREAWRAAVHGVAMSFSTVSGRSSGEGNGNPLQYSCLENPMDTTAPDLIPPFPAATSQVSAFIS